MTRVACRCGKHFKASLELAGKSVKCPSCGSPIRIPVQEKVASLFSDEELQSAGVSWDTRGQAERSEEEVLRDYLGADSSGALERPRPRCNTQHEQEGWASYRQGLDWIYMSGVVWLFSDFATAASFAAVLSFVHPGFFLFSLFATAAAVRAAFSNIISENVPEISWCLLLFAGYLLIGSGLLTSFGRAGGPLAVMVVLLPALARAVAGMGVLGGLVLCLRIPPESSMRPLLVGSVLGMLISGGLILSAAVAAVLAGFEPQQHLAGAVPVLLLLAGVAFATSHVLFILTLRQVAAYFNDEKGKDYLQQYGIYFLVVCAAAAFVSSGMLLRLFDLLTWLYLALFFLSPMAMTQQIWLLRAVAAARDSVWDRR
jgi:DNA-directed RNA polymerase subunit RPC12/RpoP